MTYDQVIEANARDRAIWRDLPLQRKLPPDWVIGCLIRFGFTYRDIADRFEVEHSQITAAARRLNLPPIDPTDRRRYRRSHWVTTSPRG